MIDFLKKILSPLSTLVRRDDKITLHVILVLGAGFLLLTLFVFLLPHSFIDLEFSEEMQEHQNPLLDALMRAISWFGVQWVAITMVVVTALLFLIKAYRREALFMVATSLSSVLAYGLKILVNRPRPTEDLVNIIEKAKHQSFPSGHTLFYVVFFGFLFFLMYRLKELPNWLRLTVAIVSLLLIFAVPFSRVYLGAHWFTDVLGGFLLGLICLAGMIRWYLGSPSTSQETAA